MREHVQALQRDGQMRATLVVGNGMDLVHDHGLDIAQQLAALFRREQNVQRLRSSDQNVRWGLEHPLPVGGRRIAGAHKSADLRHKEAALTGKASNLRQGTLQIRSNVVAEGFQRGDVNDLNLALELTGDSLVDEAINAGEKGSEGLTGSGRCRNEGRTSGKDVRPTLFLWLSGSAEF